MMNSDSEDEGVQDEIWEDAQDEENGGQVLNVENIINGQLIQMVQPNQEMNSDDEDQFEHEILLNHFISSDTSEVESSNDEVDDVEEHLIPRDENNPDEPMENPIGRPVIQAPVSVSNNNNSEQFDLQLPSRHEYLGNEMETLAGRRFLEEGQIYEIPLIILGLHLVPGQTLPLSIIHSVFQNAIRRCVSNDKIFGIVNSSSASGYNSDGIPENTIRGPRKGALGTIAEIFEFQEENDVQRFDFPSLHWPTTFALKAKGRERFNVLSIRRQGDGNLMGKVLIRSEIRYKPLLTRVSSSFASNRYAFPLASNLLNTNADEPTAMERQSISIDGEILERKRKQVKRKLNRYYSAFTPFPTFVYDEFDEEVISERILNKLRTEMKGIVSTNIVMPKDPCELSYWLAQNLITEDEVRSQILKLDTPIQRLRYEWDILKRAAHVIKCKRCENTLADYNDIFCMSIEGPTGTYVNPHGCIHETITVLKTKDVIRRGNYTTEASWFPGYSWKISECRRCRHHVGWRFKAVRSHLAPRKFFGLASKSVYFKYDFYKNEDEEGDENTNGTEQGQADEADDQSQNSRPDTAESNASTRRRRLLPRFRIL